MSGFLKIISNCGITFKAVGLQAFSILQHLAWFGVADSGAAVIPRPSAQLPGHSQARLPRPDVIFGSYKFTVRSTMAIFASLNPYISGGGQPTPTKFGSLIEPDGVHCHSKARWDRINSFRAIDDEVRRKCAKIGTPGEFDAP